MSMVLKSDLRDCSIGDAIEHRQDADSHSVSNYLQPAMRISSFSQKAAIPPPIQSARSQGLPCNVDVQFSKHSSAGSFGDFTGANSQDFLPQDSYNPADTQEEEVHRPAGTSQC